MGAGLVISNKSNYTASLSPLPRQSTQQVSQIDAQLNAEGRRAEGDRAFQASLQRLYQLFDKKSVRLSSTLDSQGNIQQLNIVDGDTGKTIFKLPPDGVVDMAEKAKQQSIGWLINVLA